MQKKLAAIAVVVFALVAGRAGWQYFSYRMAATELQEDMGDWASQAGARVGYSRPQSDDELRGKVVAKAEQYGIPLTSAQVTVMRSGSSPESQVYLAAQWDQQIRLLGFPLQVHFRAEGGHKPQ
jgi:hypothetical protein